MKMLRTSKWSSALRGATLLAGLTVILIVVLPATASGSKAGPSRSQVKAAPCGEDYSPVLIKGFSVKQGAPGRWIVIKGRRMDLVDMVEFFNGEGYDPVKFLHLDNQHIGTYVPDWAATGFLYIADIPCSWAYSPSKFVVV
jgi:hypothetical protein